MRNFWLLLLCYISFSCESPKPGQENSGHFYMPAEYEPHEAIWLGWQDFAPYREPYLEIASALIDQVQLKMIANTDSSLQNLKAALLNRNIDTNKIEFYIMSDNRLWMRDHGATYLINGKGEKQVVDFGWTAYGNYDFQVNRFKGNTDSAFYYYQKELKKTGLIDSLMAESGELESQKAAVNMEGGSIEVNGKGTLILCERVTFQRNPDMSREELEVVFKKALGVKHIIWLEEGLADDPYYFSQIVDNYYGWGTYGHTDEFVRFVNDTTVLLAWVDESEKDDNSLNWINYERMSRNLEILEKSTDQDGNRLKVIKVPLPDVVYKRVKVVENRQGDWDMNVDLNWIANTDQVIEIGDSLNRVPASSYLNYLVTNGTVLLPSYTTENTSQEKEDAVVNIFKEVFPKRKLIFINAMNLNYYGGGIHCITQQEPRGAK